jgi:outer membrane receptor protein involved in Fe transport
VVTATRLPRPQREVPATVVVMPRRELEASPLLTVDALLRTLPSAATFRRSSSLVADPSSQGLNLRGVGPSGVSRSLVLLDGVPVNDPFGGWVTWRALPRLGLERIEVVPGGGSALWGSAALGGVVQLVSRALPEAGGALDADASYGLLQTLHAGARAAAGAGRVRGGLEAEWLSSGGHPVVAAAQRGAVDGPAPSRHLTLDGQLEVRPSPALTLTARGGLFGEDQSGGTAFTTAGVRQGRAVLGADLSLGEGGGALALTLFGRAQRFTQSRARITAGRAEEALAAAQDVPSQEAGLSLVWSGGAPLEALGAHRLSAGADVRGVDGVSAEALFPPASAGPDAVVRRDAGGRQLLAGAFVQDLWAPAPDVRVDAALRLDSWRNSRGAQAAVRGGGGETREAFAPRTHTEVSPRLGLLVRPLEALALRASGWRAFRAPTLNELYRPFQVGTVLTAANPALAPETLWGAEAGAELSLGTAVVARATGFLNLLEAPVANVTLAAPRADGATRERQNLGAARVAGLEASLEARPLRPLSLLLAYTLTEARVAEAPSQPELVGKRLAQAPVHRATATLSFDAPRLFTATLQVRLVGPQFEDDLNTLPMGGYALVDAGVSRRLVGGLHAFAAVENLFDREYLVGRAGVDTVGQPLLARLGLRWREP